jgi:VCBS repeat protein/Big-like domain-containing protein
MRVLSRGSVLVLVLGGLVLGGALRGQQAAPVASGATLAVVQTFPASVAVAPVGTTVTIVFDRPVALHTIDARSFRVFGRYSGSARGRYTFSDGGRRVTFVPDHVFAAGEVVWVNLARSIRGLDGSHLRAAGHSLQFGTAVQPSVGSFAQYDVLSNTTGPQTRIYGASATDLDHDGYLDLATINEVSADVRVFLNLGDGSGNYGDFLAPEPIGDEGSPNEPADFDNDGDADLCIAATSSADVWILLGNGDGSFAPGQSVAVGQEPHGIVALDVDGDADLDIVNCNRGSNNLSLLRNDGAGVFGSPTFFEGGVNGEYGLASGDMDHDGIMDLVVAGRDGSHVRTLHGNGNGTFAPGTAQGSGGPTWVVQLGDVDGDGDLDASTANSNGGTAGILKNTGAGDFAAVTTVLLGAHTVSTDLGDLDGDGDLDWSVSSFGGGFWRLYRNNGSGTFAFWQQLDAPANPSCSLLLDTDNDGDLDLALTDEIADQIVLMRNL